MCLFLRCLQSVWMCAYPAKEGVPKFAIRHALFGFSVPDQETMCLQHLQDS